MTKIGIVLLVIVAAGVILFFTNRPEEKNPVQQVAQPLTAQEAIDKVKSRPEVKKYLSEVPGGRVDQNGSEDELYLVQVFEIKDGHTATFNWYRINKNTGAITAEFEVSENLPALSQTYKHSLYGVKFNYPSAWKANLDTQIFENGDLITMEKLGPTQKPQTDFYDGVRFTVGLPVETTANLENYISGLDPEAKFVTVPIGDNTFVKTDDYYYIKRGNSVYPLFLFAEGEDEGQNQRVLQEMLASFSLDL